MLLLRGPLVIRPTASAAALLLPTAPPPPVVGSVVVVSAWAMVVMRLSVVRRVPAPVMVVVGVGSACSGDAWRRVGPRARLRVLLLAPARPWIATRLVKVPAISIMPPSALLLRWILLLMLLRRFNWQIVAGCFHVDL